MPYLKLRSDCRENEYSRRAQRDANLALLARPCWTFPPLKRAQITAEASSRLGERFARPRPTRPRQPASGIAHHGCSEPIAGPKREGMNGRR